jgi:hypothetical protein
MPRARDAAGCDIHRERSLRLGHSHGRAQVGASQRGEEGPEVVLDSWWELATGLGLEPHPLARAAEREPEGALPGEEQADPGVGGKPEGLRPEYDERRRQGFDEGASIRVEGPPPAGERAASEDGRARHDHEGLFIEGDRVPALASVDACAAEVGLVAL